MSNQVYEIVTNKIIEQLEQGVIPWRQPWMSAINYVSRKPYRGINRLLLPKAGEYLTFKQAEERGGKIRKGAKSDMVIFFKPLPPKVVTLEDENGEEKDFIEGNSLNRAALRYYRVFHIDDVEGIESKIDFTPPETMPDAEQIINGYPNPPKISDGPGFRAFYSPTNDEVVMPSKEVFISTVGYYETLFHELVHSTGHSSRLGRLERDKAAAFGSQDYSKEELVAEIGAAMLMDACGMLNASLPNNAAYIASWLKALKDDKLMIVAAAGQAEKAVDWIRGAQGLEVSVDVL